MLGKGKKSDSDHSGLTFPGHGKESRGRRVIPVLKRKEGTKTLNQIAVEKVKRGRPTLASGFKTRKGGERERTTRTTLRENIYMEDRVGEKEFSKRIAYEKEKTTNCECGDT